MPIRETQQEYPLAEFWQQIGAFLPSLAAGLLVLAIGLLAGWLAKRFVVRLLIWLRLDRLAGRVGWRAAFGKGDVRATLYNLTGNVSGLIILLVFLDDALNRWGLTAISRISANIVSYLPNLALVAVIVGVGMMVSNTLSVRVRNSLEEEGVTRARLVGKCVKGSLIAVVTALALWQLHLAREIVLAAFLISFGSIGVAFAIALGLGSYRAIERALSQLFEKQDERD
jgi:hypothetical protein